MPSSSAAILRSVRRILSTLQTARRAYRQVRTRDFVLHVARRTFLERVAKRPEMVIIQVGAYVGDTGNDPLAGFLKRNFDPARPEFLPRARAILIEPVPSYFRALQANYAHLPNVTCENLAIAGEPGERPFYRLGVDPRDHGMPEWLGQLASLRADRVTTLWDENEGAHGNPAEWQRFYNEHVVSEPVRCDTLGSVLRRHAVTRVDLLVVDTEGYDYEVLKTVDWRAWHPRFVNYERTLLGQAEPECRRMMRQAGYRLLDWDQDTLCW